MLSARASAGSSRLRGEHMGGTQGRSNRALIPVVWTGCPASLKPLQADRRWHVMSEDTMTPEAAFFPLPLCWTTIAERPRENARRLHWHERTGAPLCALEARTLAAKGAIIMAQRYLPDRVELVVRPVMRDPRSRRA
jgi:hypothetical protein